jgi:O2-independent ubiquinone biosynthesis accessory factor UbiT
VIPLPPLPLPKRLREALEPLRGKILRIELAGIPIAPQFTLTTFGLSPVFGKADVTIRANSPADYLALALRQEDPDTLFFTRRLVLEGDTALGLEIKNALDSLSV